MPYLTIEQENKVSKNLNENYSYQQAKILAKIAVDRIINNEYKIDPSSFKYKNTTEHKILLDAVAEIYCGVQESTDEAWRHKSRYLEKSINNSDSSYSKIRVWDLARKEAEKVRTSKLGVGEKLTTGERDRAIREIFFNIYNKKKDGTLEINTNSPFLHTSGTLSSAEYGEILKNLFGNVRKSEMSERQRELLEKYLKEANLSSSTVTDPLLIDLNGDGIKTTNVNEDLKFFDHENDGYAEMTSWADTNDGVLFYDKNNNGIIDNGSELFG